MSTVPGAYILSNQFAVRKKQTTNEMTIDRSSLGYNEGRSICLHLSPLHRRLNLQKFPRAEPAVSQVEPSAPPSILRQAQHSGQALLREAFGFPPLLEGRQGRFHSECHSVQMLYGSIEERRPLGTSETAVPLESQPHRVTIFPRLPQL